MSLTNFSIQIEFYDLSIGFLIIQECAKAAIIGNLKRSSISFFRFDFFHENRSQNDFTFQGALADESYRFVLSFKF